MYHMMILSENRSLLKELYEMVEDDSLFRVHVIPFSTDAYEEFYSTHSDIVIMDSEVFLSYTTIIKHFEQCPWEYHVIVLSNDNELYIENSKVIYLRKSSLTHNILQETLQKILDHKVNEQKNSVMITLNLNGEVSIISHQDAYHIFLLKCTRKDTRLSTSILEKLISETEIYGKLNIVMSTEKEVLFYLRRFELNNNFNLHSFAQTIFHITDGNYALIYLENIHWQQLQQCCEYLFKHSNYSYFFENQFVSLMEIKVDSKMLLSKVDLLFSQLLVNILHNDKFMASQILQEIYFHILKPSYSFQLRAYVRNKFNLICQLVNSKILCDDSYEYTSIEEEFEKKKLCIEDLCNNSFSSEHISKIIIKASIKISEGYMKPISLDGIAQELNLNKIYLNKIYKVHFGITIVDTLQLYRITVSKCWLINSDWKISHIANQSGFIDSGYFTKFFYKHTGMTPQDFRTKYFITHSIP